MKNVQPFRDLNDIEKMKKALNQGQNGKRNILLFIMGINLNLRISDLLTLTVADVKNQTHIEIVEQKTGKPRLTFINETIQNLIKPFIKGKKPTDYLFSSRQGKNVPLTRQMVEYTLSKAAVECGITYRVGCHSMRKTWGYHAWKSGVHLAVIQTAFNHSKLETTYKYLGITQDELDKAFGGLSL